MYTVIHREIYRKNIEKTKEKSVPRVFRPKIFNKN